MAIKVVMPQMGEAVVEATITKWLKAKGDQVQAYEPLVEVNTDKVDTEVPSPASGVVLKIVQPEEATVAVDGLLAWIGEPGEAIPEDGEGDELAKAQPIKETPPAPAPERAPTATIPKSLASPVAARVAAERGIDLAQVPGSGANGRVTKQDVLNYLNGRAAVQQPAVPVAASQEDHSYFISPAVARLAAQNKLDLSKITGTGKGGRITTRDVRTYLQGRPKAAARPVSSVESGSVIKLNPVRKSIAEHMAESVRTSPHVSTIMEADMSAVIAHRQAHKGQFAEGGARLTFTAYFVVAAAEALQAYPLVNSSWTEQGIAVHKDVNIGMATDLGEQGLIVPVIKAADQLPLLEAARTVNDLAERARHKKLQPDEVHGGTFTITNHGTSGSLFATPIINQPQCAILGVGAIQKRAVVIDDAIAIRPMVYLGLTFDHRILDGAAGDHFLSAIKDRLERWA
jgi:pyruvate/2-oxoglutarate dehydrogenase complex dihydrolipoamide acyltransferase (E2) component